MAARNSILSGLIPGHDRVPTLIGAQRQPGGSRPDVNRSAAFPHSQANSVEAHG